MAIFPRTNFIIVIKSETGGVVTARKYSNTADLYSIYFKAILVSSGKSP